MIAFTKNLSNVN